MEITEKLQLADLEHIRLEHFLFVLKCSIDGSDKNEFDVFSSLLDKGLLLSFTESGFIFDKKIAFEGDVKYALEQVKNMLFETDTCKSKIYKDVSVKTQHGIEIPIGNLLVKRSEIERIYSAYGVAKFPWALVLWPQSSNEWAFFATKPQAKTLTDDSTPDQQAETPIDDGKKKKSKNQLRNEDFKKWLESEPKPNLEAMQSKSEIHTQLIARNRKLWVSDFPGWWKQQTFIKFERGRRPR